MSDVTTKSEELFELYEGLGDVSEDLEPEEPTGRKSLEAIYALSQWQLMWRKFIRNKVAIVGGIVILLYYLGGLFAGFVAPYTLSTRFVKYIHMPPQRIRFFNDGKLQPFVCDLDLTIDENLRKTYTPNCDKRIPLEFFSHGEPYKLLGLIDTDVHLFQAPGGIVSLLGTDRQGRDMFSRVLYGSQVSLTIGLLGVAFSLVFGSVLGVASGYYGGWIDDLIQRSIELVRAFPAIPLWMALSAAVPPHWPPLRTYFAVTIILSVIGWTWLARQLRGKVLALRDEDFVLAAKLAGASDVRIIFRHLIPATFGHIIVVSTLAMPSMILAETALSFLGLGLRPPITSWGVLLKEVQNIQSMALYPWVFTPALAIAIAILAFNFLGDGLRDAADPYTV
ncbi:MAG: ABC transporter permease [Anaerolineae bacterium]|jgi:peptide/nickel transport system permease protein|nr:ABC transporter permease [Anaerolineae bacterium]